jgi:chitin synthase
MYRIKSPKGGSGYWVPILANPDIVEHYSENIVDTLHKKNLLLLGEDRYLSTLMLKTFPKRKMVFCPQAVCKTIVPDTFKILLSQRRRWINSTIHNLFELMLVRDLCGTFCFSMQFVVFMDLVGTLVLPAAIAFTLYVLFITIIPESVTKMPKPIISLILLAFILGLPGVLIVITSRKVVYVGWMLVYLISLPIWNFMLPAYSFWHMDDFSWGETRKIEGEAESKAEASHGDKEGTFDSSHIVMKRWIEFERERRWREGTTSRDSYYDVIHRSNSPGNTRAHNRHSLVSTSESYNLNTSVDSRGGAQYVMNPAEMEPPNSFLNPGGRGAREPSMGRSAESGHSARRAPVAGPAGYYGEEEQPMLHHTVSGNTTYPSGGYDETPESTPHSTPQRGQRYPQPPPTARGVSLVDPGVVAGAQDPVRRVARQQHKRGQSSGGGRHGMTSPTGSSGPSIHLPPGAVSRT